ncbi:MAG: hypothetical protein PHI73_05425 [Patescibacteria group bacterium]|nr:hypothetical protein [Patescibacteria group bacterium]
MGSQIELNDTLQITTDQGFPRELILETHLKKPFTADAFNGRVFSFVKPDKRLFHSAPTRVFLVHNINGKWLYWGHCQIIEQTIHAEKNNTTGKFIITKIYPPDYQRQISLNEIDPGKEYFVNQ